MANPTGATPGYRYLASGGDNAARSTTSLLYYLDVLRRRVWIVLTVALLLATIGVIGAWRAPKLYQGVAKVLVERQSARLMGFEGIAPEGPGAWWDPQYFSTQEGLVRSRVVLEMALENVELSRRFDGALGTVGAGRAAWRRSLDAILGRKPRPPPEDWERLRAEIGTEIVKDTSFILIKSVGGDRERVALVVNAVAEAFQRYHVERQVEALGDAFAYLQREKEKEEAELRKAENELQTFRESIKGMPLRAADGDTPIQDRLVRLNNRLTEVQLKRTTLTAKVNAMRQIMGATNRTALADAPADAPLLDADPELVALRRQVLDAEKELIRLGDVYGPDHVRLKAAQGNWDVLRRQYRDALQRAIANDSQQIVMYEEEERALRVLYEEERVSTLALARDAFTMTHLQNAVDRHRRLYDALVQRMLEVDISSGFAKTKAQVVERASIPKAPMDPRRLQKFSVFAFLGLFLGVVLAFVVENLDDSVRTPEDIRERLDLPLLGFVPTVPLTKKPDDQADFAYRGTITLREPLSSVAESYRHLRTSLFYSIPAGEIKVLGVASSTPREGKTTTTCNLAIAIAQSGRRTLLIDGDLHRPMVHRTFGLADERGVTTCLVGETTLAAAVQPVIGPDGAASGLDVLTAGPVSPNPAELLGSQRMRALIAEARAQYDWVLIDTPPVLFVSDACVIAALCDGLMLVVRAGSGHRGILTRTKEQLTQVRARIIGVVLNGMIVSRMGRYYSDYYYHGHARYARDYRRSYYGPEGRPDRPAQAAGGTSGGDGG